MTLDARELALSMPAGHPGRAAILQQLGQREPAAEVKPEPAGPRGMNRWEQSYADHLALRQAAGEVRWFEFEAVRLLVTKPGGRKRAFYKPDFFVVLASGECELHEVKGHWREAARLRVKLALDAYPWPVLICRKVGGAWETERL